MSAAVEMTLDEFAAAAEASGKTVSGGDFTRPLKVCKQLIVADVKSNFADSHDPDGTPWLPLAHSRPNSKGEDKPLKDKNILGSSVTSNRPGHVETMTRDTLIIGTNLDYAGTHQDGGIILPRSAKALAIPLTKEAARVDSPREFSQPLFVLKSGDHAFLAQRKMKGRGKKKNESLILHYILLKSVKIPQRQFLGVGAKLMTRLEDAVCDHAAMGLLDF